MEKKEEILAQYMDLKNLGKSTKKIFEAAMNEFALAFGKYCGDNDFKKTGDNEWEVGVNKYTTDEGILELFNNQQ